MESQKIKDGTPVFAVRRDESGKWLVDNAWRASTRPDSLLWRYDATTKKIVYCWLKPKEGEKCFAINGDAERHLSSLPQDDGNQGKEDK